MSGPHVESHQTTTILRGDRWWVFCYACQREFEPFTPPPEPTPGLRADTAPVIDDYFPDATFDMRRGWELAIKTLLDASPAPEPTGLDAGWWHPEACIDRHDDDHNCLDEGGSIIGWREFVSAARLKEPTE